MILVDGEALLGLLKELDGWDVVAAYFADLELREDIDRRAGGSVEAEAGDTLLRKQSRCFPERGRSAADEIGASAAAFLPNNRRRVDVSGW